MTDVEYDRSCVGCEMRRIHRQANEVSYILSSLPASSPLRVATGADSEVSRARTRSIRVGQGFWVYGIQGLFISGIRYIAA